MRIPAEVVPPVANIGRESDEVSKPEPVTGAKGSNNALSSALPKPPWPAPERPRREPHEAAPEKTPTQAENPPAVVERRQKERRSEKRPVLLDTRSKNGRRKAGGDVKINIKV